jgi:tungstate transport system substrate-binding protein
VRRLPVLLLLAMLVSACGSESPRVLRLATTTSTEDSGLLEAILPDFEQRHNARVDVVAVGTGQALELARRGDADVVLVHARSAEDLFLEEGFGTARFDVMYNDFVLIGPEADPAGARASATAAEALAVIAQTGETFVSRGDDSGTHAKERSLWRAAGTEPDVDSGWYLSIGQGMGEALQMAAESRAYTLSDRGTYLSMLATLPGLTILFGGANIAENTDPDLLNPYGVIPVNPAKVAGVDYELAVLFAEWLISPETQAGIGSFVVDVYGQPLFYPNADTP